MERCLAEARSQATSDAPSARAHAARRLEVDARRHLRATEELLEEARRRAASSRRFAEEAIRRGLARPLYMEEALFRARQVTTLTLLRSEALASLEGRQAASARLRSAQR